MIMMTMVMYVKIEFTAKNTTNYDEDIDEVYYHISRIDEL